MLRQSGNSLAANDENAGRDRRSVGPMFERMQPAAALMRAFYRRYDLGLGPCPGPSALASKLPRDELGGQAPGMPCRRDAPLRDRYAGAYMDVRSLVG